VNTMLIFSCYFVGATQCLLDHFNDPKHKHFVTIFSARTVLFSTVCDSFIPPVPMQ